MAQVIEIISDNDDEDCEIFEELPRKKLRCLNLDCNSVYNLIKASDSVTKFYGVDVRCKRKRICQNCLKHALLEKNTIINLLKSGTNLFSKNISLAKKTFVLPESDESDSGSSSDHSEYEYDPLQIKGSITHSRSCAQGSTLVTEDDKKELKNIILDIIIENDLQKQISDGQRILQRRLLRSENQFINLNQEFKYIERKLDDVRNGFYNSFIPSETFAPSLEIGPPEMFNGTVELTEVISKASLITSSNLPPIAPLIRNPIKCGDKVYLKKSFKLSKWVEGMILCIELLPGASETIFQVQYLNDKCDKHLQKFVSAKNLAYFWECPVRVPIGTRIIAFVENNNSKYFYVGIISEMPTAANKFRYLVFFEDGYAQYVTHSNIRVVCQGAVNIWEDVEEDSRNFIKEYLDTYPERPMVRLHKGNYIKTELEGDWFKAEVLEVDCSLVKMFFPIQCRYEWIYRGSTRFSPLYLNKINSKIKSEYPNRIIRRRTLPVNKKVPIVEYINIAPDENDKPDNDFPNVDKPEDNLNEFQKPEENLNKFQKPEDFMLNAADKSLLNLDTVQKTTSFQEQNMCSIPITEQLMLESQGYYTTIKCNISSNVKFSPHQCSFKCIKESNDILDSRICSPLIKPLMLGWKRQISKQRKKTVLRLVCCYVAPCCRRLRTYDEILMYLMLTKSNLQIDEFSLDTNISLLSAWEPSEKKVYITDITDGREYVHISCVNSIDSSPPKKLLYCSERVPSEKVLMNLDVDHLVCCSCKDGCKNKEKCECWQLTLGTANNLFKEPRKILNLGYNYKKLLHQIPSGIYECNAKCSCKESCFNRVVQFPIKQKLQLFKTAKRGWGIRTLNDIAKGTFVCVYVGKVLTETEANEDGLQDGADEYYANLDYIEVVESYKEGYESDVEDIIDEEKINGSSEKSSSESDFIDSDDSDKSSRYSKRKRKKIQSKEYDSKISVAPREKSVRIQTRSVSKDDKTTSLGKVEKSTSLGKDENSTSLGKVDKSTSLGKDDSEDSNDSLNRLRQTFEPKEIGNSNLFQKPATKSIRDFYTNDEAVYVMDAKVVGNIGRYINHSCDPNLFVQNVFVDTHDPRFPWISFFAAIDIKAGTELTWDYNYEVGSVPGRIKYCYCKSSNCRGRLL